MNVSTFFALPFVRDINVVAYTSTVSLGLAWLGWALLKTMGKTMTEVGDHWRKVHREKEDKLARAIKEEREQVIIAQTIEREESNRLRKMRKDQEAEKRREEAEHIVAATLRGQPPTDMKPPHYPLIAGCYIRFRRSACNGALVYDPVEDTIRVARKGDIVQIIQITSNAMLLYKVNHMIYHAKPDDVEVIG